MSRFLDVLHSGRVLLMDGAMGTELMRAGIEPHQCFEALNITQPHLVESIHRTYANAGADILLTNTFQTNPERLARQKWRGKTVTIYEAAIRLARQTASAPFVLADVGPVLENPRAELSAILPGCMHADALLAETWSDANLFGELAELNFGKFGYCHPLLVSFAFRRSADGTLSTYRDFSAANCAKIAMNFHASALGVNCGTDIRLPELLEIIAEYRSITDLPLFVRPNAGTPRQVNGEWIYPETPESMAAWLPPLFEAGVRMVGGCCGTTPAHIAAFRKIVEEWNASHGDFSSQ